MDFRWPFRRAGHVLVIGLLLAGCTSTRASPSASGSAALPSEAASVAVSASPSAAAFPVVDLPPNSLATLGAEADLHNAPGDPVLGSLEAGSEVILIAGPREYRGETWYQVEFPPDSSAASLAWVRAETSQAFLSVEPACPAAGIDPAGLLAWDRVRCLAGQTLTVEGEVSHCQGGVVFVEPEWLAYACWAVRTAAGDMQIHASPESGIVFPDDIVRARMTGHVDDPAATTCVYHHNAEGDQLWLEPSDGEQVYLCREAFVVDTFEILEVIGPALS